MDGPHRANGWWKPRPGTSGPHYTVVATLGVDGVQAPLLFEGAMTTLTFDTYVEEVLAPTLQHGEILLMDNLSAHKSGQAQATLEAQWRAGDFPAAVLARLEPH